MPCETCEGKGRVPDHSGNFPDRPGITAGPFVDMMECPDCCGDSSTHRVECPECGVVDVSPDIFNNGRPVSANCPKCEGRLYFETEDMAHDEACDCPVCCAPKCPHCIDGYMRINGDGSLWCDKCESLPAAVEVDPKCPMCGVLYVDHDGLTVLCRRYHRLRVELKSLMGKWLRDSESLLINPLQHKVGTCLLDAIYGVELALGAAESNEVAS